MISFHVLAQLIIEHKFQIKMITFKMYLSLALLIGGESAKLVVCAGLPPPYHRRATRVTRSVGEIQIQILRNTIVTVGEIQLIHLEKDN